MQCLIVVPGDVPPNPLNDGLRRLRRRRAYVVNEGWQRVSETISRLHLDVTKNKTKDG